MRRRDSRWSRSGAASCRCGSIWRTTHRPVSNGPYGGSGPAQLALALLAHATGNDALAVRQHQKFKWKVIANLDRNAEWTMTRERIRAISQQISETRSLASQEGRW